MTPKYKLPRGTFDILPDQSKKWQFIRDKFQQICERYAYFEIQTPIFEQADLFERSIGDTSDIIEKEMYKFKDKKGRIYALRPEGTAPVVRSVVANNLVQPQNPIKIHYMGPMFRYDRPQKGRYRQFHQYGIEFIGSDDPYIDAEVIALGDTFLKELGLKNYTLEINSIGCPDCSGDFEKALKEYYEPYKDSLCNDCQIRLDKNPKRLLDCKVQECKKISENVPSILDYLDDKCRIHYDAVKKYLKDLEIPFIINPRIVRGLDYYSQTAFEFVDTNLGAQSTLIGGGRYNGLMAQLGGKDYPGIGFAGGFERLLLSLEVEKISFGESPSPTAFFVFLGKKAKKEGIKLIQQLRRYGISCDFALQKESMKAQMKAADKCKAKFALILGDNELENNEIVVKDLALGSQQKIGLANIIDFFNKKKS